MNMDASPLVHGSWIAWVLALPLVYLSVLFFKESRRHVSELRGAFLINAVLLIPVLLLSLFVYDGHLGRIFQDQLPANRDVHNWWVLRFATESGVPWNLNVLETLITFSFLYIGVSLLVAFLEHTYFRRKKGGFLSIHKALLKWTVVFFGLVLIQNINFWPVLLGMGAASVVLGFALKEMLENLFTGMALDMEGTFHTGDWIRLGDSDTVGRVYEKHWRSTKILTLQDESITIPNRMLGAETILTYGKPLGLFACTLPVGTSYNDPPVKVKEILRTILNREPLVANQPSPVVRTEEYADFSINYKMKFWIKDFGQIQNVCDSIMTQVWYAFKFYGIQIPFPIRTVHHFNHDYVQETEVAIEDEVSTKRTFVEGLHYFRRHLRFRDLDFLARNSFQRRYAPGEHIIHRGEVGDALYIVMDGTCEVRLPDDRRAVLKQGQYFGEMGLLGARRRTADVLAGEEGVAVIRVDKHCMDVLFRTYPDLFEEFRLVRDVRERELPLREPESQPTVVHPLHRMGRAIRRFLWPW